MLKDIAQSLSRELRPGGDGNGATMGRRMAPAVAHLPCSPVWPGGARWRSNNQEAQGAGALRIFWHVTQMWTAAAPHAEELGGSSIGESVHPLRRRPSRRHFRPSMPLMAVWQFLLSVSLQDIPSNRWFGNQHVFEAKKLNTASGVPSDAWWGQKLAWGGQAMDSSVDTSTTRTGLTWCINPETRRFTTWFFCFYLVLLYLVSAQILFSLYDYQWKTWADSVFVKNNI